MRVETMTSADFLNYALGTSAIITAFGTGVVSLMTFRRAGRIDDKAGRIDDKSTRIEKHTNGMVEIMTDQAATSAKFEERRGNIERGGTTGKGSA